MDYPRVNVYGKPVVSLGKNDHRTLSLPWRSLGEKMSDLSNQKNGVIYSTLVGG